MQASWAPKLLHILADKTASHLQLQLCTTSMRKSLLNHKRPSKIPSNITIQASWERRLLHLPVVPMATLLPSQLYTI
jgi:hypothetical protein